MPAVAQRGGGKPPPPPPDPAIAYCEQQGGRFPVKVMNSDGTNQAVVFQDPSTSGFHYQPAMSADGRQVTVVAPRGGNPEDCCLWVVGSDSAGPRVVTPLRVYQHIGVHARFSPVPTPDGRNRILFVDALGRAEPERSVYQLFTIDIDGSGLVQLTVDTGGIGRAALDWSHDATRIVFTKGGSQLVSAQLGLVEGRLAITSRAVLNDDPAHPLRGGIGHLAWANTADVVVVSADSAAGPGRHLWLVPVHEPLAAVQLTATAGYEYAPSFSPDDTLVYFFGWYGGWQNGSGVQVLRVADRRILGTLPGKGAYPHHRRR